MGRMTWKIAFRGLMIAAVVATLSLAWGTAWAQQGASINSGRDCQVVRTCNFARNGAVRGCLSSYTCRTCRLVKARCTIAGRSRCEQMVCSWGG